MSITIECPSCGQRLKAPKKDTGKKRCPECGHAWRQSVDDLAVALLLDEDPTHGSQEKAPKKANHGQIVSPPEESVETTPHKPHSLLVRRLVLAIPLAGAALILLGLIYITIPAYFWARSPEDTKHRFVVRLHETSPSWGEVEWLEGVPSLEKLEAKIIYSGEFGVHVFEVSESPWGNYIDVRTELMQATYNGLEYDEKMSKTNCPLAEAGRLRSLCDQLKDAMYWARH